MCARPADWLRAELGSRAPAACNSAADLTQDNVDDNIEPRHYQTPRQVGRRPSRDSLAGLGLNSKTICRGRQRAKPRPRGSTLRRCVHLANSTRPTSTHIFGKTTFPKKKHQHYCNLFKIPHLKITIIPNRRRIKTRTMYPTH